MSNRAFTLRSIERFEEISPTQSRPIYGQDLLFFGSAAEARSHAEMLWKDQQGDGERIDLEWIEGNEGVPFPLIGYVWTGEVYPICVVDRAP